jgi:hypothetical protein
VVRGEEVIEEEVTGNKEIEKGLRVVAMDMRGEVDIKEREGQHNMVVVVVEAEGEVTMV